MTQRHEVSKCSWKNSANRLAQGGDATKFQFVKNAVSAKHSEVKHNKTRYACKQNHVACIFFLSLASFLTSVSKSPLPPTLKQTHNPDFSFKVHIIITNYLIYRRAFPT